MPESGPYGSVPGALSNERPYRDCTRPPAFGKSRILNRAQSDISAKMLAYARNNRRVASEHAWAAPVSPPQPALVFDHLAFSSAFARDI